MEKFNHKRKNIKIYYPIYSFIYQVGVLLSRSIKLTFPDIHFNNIKLFVSLQLVNFIFCLCESIYHFIPSVYILYFIIFYEGLLGGLSYVFTFNKINKQITEDKRELCSATTTIGDISGQTSASLLSLYLENALTKYN